MTQQAVVETTEFIKRTRAVGISDKDRKTVIDQLAANPEAGISLSGGLRKVRVARRGSGRSGGYRVLHLYRSPDMPLFLLTVFAKNEKVNITRLSRPT
ncbi:MAG: type II toxin-antitoxin system RelE/ParE family toxin [Pseudomonadota bacterium]